jgi:hypothetical protein
MLFHAPDDQVPAPSPGTCSLVGQETLAGDGEQAPEASAHVRGGSGAVQKKRTRCSESRPTLAPVRDHKTHCCALDRCQPGGFAGQQDIESRPTAPRSSAPSAHGDFPLTRPTARDRSRTRTASRCALAWLFHRPSKTGKVLVHPGGQHRSRRVMVSIIRRQEPLRLTEPGQPYLFPPAAPILIIPRPLPTSRSGSAPRDLARSRTRTLSAPPSLASGQFQKRGRSRLAVQLQPFETEGRSAEVDGQCNALTGPRLERLPLLNKISPPAQPPQKVGVS